MAFWVVFDKYVWFRNVIYPERVVINVSSFKTSSATSCAAGSRLVWWTSPPPPPKKKNL